MSPLDFKVAMRVEAATYKGEKWFAAKAGCFIYGVIAYARTPSRSAAFALEELAAALKSGDIELPEPTNEGANNEIVELYVSALELPTLEGVP